MTFPIDRKNERSFSTSWSGEVFICDIDRTYLATRFSTFKGLARIPFEFAVDKVDIEGMVPLFKEIRRGPTAQSRSTPLYFISASPSQLRPVIERKMLLDGLEFDGTIFKSWGTILRSLRLGRLRDQLGFKLTALLSGRLATPADAEEVLIGDDLETDALTFVIYHDLLAGSLDEQQFLTLAAYHGVAQKDAQFIARLRRRIPANKGVKRAFIRLERHQTAEPFLDVAPHLVACWGAFQMAISLWDQGSISAQGVVRVAQSLLEREETTSWLQERMDNACYRALIDRAHAEEICAILTAAGVAISSEKLPTPAAHWRTAPDFVDPLRWTPRRILRAAML